MFLAPLTAAFTTSTVNLDIDALMSSMTEIKQMTESPRAKLAQTVSAGEPAQSPVERVTKKKVKDPK